MWKTFKILALCWGIGIALFAIAISHEMHLDEEAEPGTPRYERIHNEDYVSEEIAIDEFTLILMGMAGIAFMLPVFWIPFSLMRQLGDGNGVGLTAKMFQLKDESGNTLSRQEFGERVLLKPLEDEIAALEKELEEQHNLYQDYRKIDKLNKTIAKKKADLEKKREALEKIS